MSEAEFDSYLSLLSKFLRLRARQRGELADELRDHLNSRLEELLAAGKTREEAVAVALEEFGDAAVLATEFSRLASRRTRRFVMRCTAASAAVVAAVILVSVSLAPPGPNGPGPDFVAAQPGAEGGDAAGGLSGMGGVPAVPDKTSVEQQAVAALDEKLGKVVKAEFEQARLREVLQSVAESIEADLILDEIAFTDAGVNIDDSVTLILTRTSVSARTVLDFLLEPYDLTFVNRSGVLFVTTADLADELLVTKVYNVRDLLENARSNAYGTGIRSGDGVSGGGFFSVADRAAAMSGAVGQLGGGGEAAAGGDGAMPGMPGGMSGMMGGAGGGPAKPDDSEDPVDALIATIQTTTSGPWVDTDGTGGTITVFNGLLVVRQTEQVHGEVQKLLEALREAARQQPGGVTTVPDGPPPPAGYDPNYVPSTDATTNATAATSPRMTREEFDRFVAGLKASDAVRDAFVKEFTRSGGRRSLGQVYLFGRLVAAGGAPVEAAFASLNVAVEDVVNAASGSGIQGVVASPQELMDQAAMQAARLGDPHVEARHVLLALVSGDYQPIRDFVMTLNVTPEELREQLSAPPAAEATGQTGQPTAGDQLTYAAWAPLGLTLADVTEDEWQALRRDQPDRPRPWVKGRISKVVAADPAGLAAAAGVQAGDVIEVVNVYGGGGAPVSSVHEALSRKADRFTLNIARPNVEGGFGRFDVSIDGTKARAEPTDAAAIPRGLGERFAVYRPTAKMRLMFLQAIEDSPPSAAGIGEVTMFRTLLSHDGPARAVFGNAGIETARLHRELEKGFKDRPLGDLYAFLDAAQAEAKKDGLDTIDTGHLLVVLLDRGHDGPLRDLLSRMGIGIEEAKRWLSDYRKTTPPDQRNPLQTGSNAADGASTEGPLRSTVRIRVKDGQDMEIGSGTVIGRSRSGEILVLTCWHIFRDLEGATGEVSVFPEGPAGPSETVTGRLVASNPEADLGLVAISTSRELPAVPVADLAEAVKRGDEVFSVGCSNAEPPTAERHTVIRINPYRGPSSIECTDMPSVGRAGGGLFTSAGKLVGVCFAAARQDETGVYVGLGEIHELLKNAKERDDAAGEKPEGKSEAAFYEPSGEEVNWPELGLQMTAVKNPQWFDADDRTHNRAAIGLRVDQTRSRLRKGDVIVSYSADRWTKSPLDAETITFGGREIPSPERITRDVALAHGTTEVVFRVVRVENGLPRIVSVRVPIAEAEEELDASAE